MSEPITEPADRNLMLAEPEKRRPPAPPGCKRKKWCDTCGKRKHLGQYGTGKPGVYHSTCKACRTEEQKHEVARLKADRVKKRCQELARLAKEKDPHKLAMQVDVGEAIIAQHGGIQELVGLWTEQIEYAMAIEPGSKRALDHLKAQVELVMKALATRDEARRPGDEMSIDEIEAELKLYCRTLGLTEVKIGGLTIDAQVISQA